MRHIRNTVLAVLGLSIMLSIGVHGKAEATTSHWSSPIVYVENHAPGWPIRRAAENLDNRSSLDLRVVKKCPPGKSCIRVYTKKNIPGRVIGRTYTWSVGSQTTAVTVYLETRWGNQASRKQRLGLVCHELGHAVGLNHSSKGNTCMKKGATQKRPTHISKSERNKLDRWY